MTQSSPKHAEYKIPDGKLLVVDLEVAAERLAKVQLSGDFFLEPPETLDKINQALTGLPTSASPQDIKQAAQAVIGPEVQMYGINIAALAVVIQRALA